MSPTSNGMVEEIEPRTITAEDFPTTAEVEEERLAAAAGKNTIVA